MASLNSNNRILDHVLDSFENLSDDRKDNIRQNSYKIFERIPHEGNDIPSNVGLLVGKIQSGKTSNMLALTANAFDNGYKIAVMILSDTNNLLDQNFLAVQRAFDGLDDVIVFKESNVEGDFKGTDEDELNYYYRHNKKIIICTLKHYLHINTITRTLKGSKYVDDYSLIIDDESDDASQNTDLHKFDGEANVESERSTTNESIFNLKRIFRNSSYLSITATPQANILLQKFQTLTPDFCYGIEPGEGYRGLVDFHLPDNGKIEIVTDFDKDKFEEESYIPHSLYEAFCYFIAGVVVRKHRESGDFKQSFLIHPSERIISHKKLYTSFKKKVHQISYDLDRKNESGYRFLSDVSAEYKKLGYDPTDLTLEYLFEIITAIKWHCINSRSDQKDLINTMKHLPYHVIVGGNMLDRGIAIEGLTVSYMTRGREKGQVDTLLQRARWFGYRSEYFDLCKVYLTVPIKEEYEDIIEHDESVWEFVNFCSSENVNMKDEKPELILNSQRLKPTNPRKALFEFHRVIGSTCVQKSFTINKRRNYDNVQLIQRYEDLDGDEIVFNEHQTHKAIPVTVADLKHIICNFYFKDDDPSIDPKNVLMQIENLGLKDSDPVDFVQMRYKTNEIRSTINPKSTRIINLLQGYDVNKSKDSDDYYPGDRYVVSNNITLQVHHLILRNNVDSYYQKGDEIVMLALFFPNDYSVKDVVTRKDISSNYIDY